ncbi:MAG: hypothetical protein ABI873_17895 [Marmoricola sp.]
MTAHPLGSPSTDPVTALSLGRITLGAVTIGNPELGARLFQLDVGNNKQLPYLTRMFGSREIALGTLTLLARGKARRRLVLAGIAVDGADAYAGVAAGQDGSVSKNTSALLAGHAAVAALAGVVSLRRARRTGRAAIKGSPAVGAPV